MKQTHTSTHDEYNTEDAVFTQLLFGFNGVSSPEMIT